MTQPQGAAARRVPYDRGSLLDVAVAVFNERGYDGTSMDDLARAAGISKSSFYHHVDGKEALLAAACERALTALEAVQAACETSDGRAVERLDEVVRETTRALLAELPYVTVLLRVRGNTQTERLALDRRRAFDRFAAELVAAAIADGDLRADVEPALATRLIFGMVNSISEWYRADGRAARGRVGSNAEPLGRPGKAGDDIVNAVAGLAMRGLGA